MTDAIVIGAGISGLCAAYRLQQSGRSVIVIERSPRVGGMIHSERTEGYLLEYGPNSIQSGTPLIRKLIRDLGLEGRRVEAAESAGVRYLVRNGQPVAAPASPGALMTSNLFGARAKLRLMREPFVPASPPDSDESVADFVQRRLGKEVLDYAVNPFVAGVFAGDPRQLSMRHSFPALFELEQKHGSIIKGQIESRRDTSSLADTGRMFSFREGISELTDRLREQLRDVRLERTAHAITCSSEGWVIETGIEQLRSRSVISTIPLHRLRHVALPEGFPVDALNDVEYAPLSVVFHGYPRELVRHPLTGFGILVPEVEHRFGILGTLFTSSVFPGRAPEGYVLLTSFVGGMRKPELANKSDDHVHRLVHQDHVTLLGARNEPTFTRAVRWPQSIPQYTTGYDDVLAAVESVEARFGGLFLAGNYRGGISIGDAADSGDDAAARCHAFLSQEPISHQTRTR